MPLVDLETLEAELVFVGVSKVGFKLYFNLTHRGLVSQSNTDTRTQTLTLKLLTQSDYVCLKKTFC